MLVHGVDLCCCVLCMTAGQNVTKSTNAAAPTPLRSHWTCCSSSSSLLQRRAPHTSPHSIPPNVRYTSTHPSCVLLTSIHLPYCCLSCFGPPRHAAMSTTSPRQFNRAPKLLFLLFVVHVAFRCCTCCTMYIGASVLHSRTCIALHCIHQNLWVNPPAFAHFLLAARAKPWILRRQRRD